MEHRDQVDARGIGIRFDPSLLVGDALLVLGADACGADGAAPASRIAGRHAGLPFALGPSCLGRALAFAAPSPAACSSLSRRGGPDKPENLANWDCVVALLFGTVELWEV